MGKFLLSRSSTPPPKRPEPPKRRIPSGGSGRWAWVYIFIITAISAAIGSAIGLAIGDALWDWVSQIREPAQKPIAVRLVDAASPPHLRHLEYKRYMLELINAERRGAGLSPVALGDNVAAQLHAEAALEGCFGGHWGMDGLKPYMRYSLSGGYQSNSENGYRGSWTVWRGSATWTGMDYCLTKSDGGFSAPQDDLRTDIDKAMSGLMSSPGHRRNILTPSYKKVNIGMAWDGFNFKAYQHFEGDYIEYDELPEIENGVLSFTGSLKNNASVMSDDDLSVQIYYDRPPKPLTRGQLSLTYCYSFGTQVATLRYPLTGNQYWVSDEFTKTSDSSCLDPYRVPADTPEPQSPDEERAFKQAARAATQSLQPVETIVPLITATGWNVSRQGFSVKANIAEVVGRHGAGVYTVTLWAMIDGEDAVVSQYSIFHGVTPPDTYSLSR